MSEKEMFIQGWDREFATTLRVVKAYPTDKFDLTPTHSKRSAKDLAWVLAGSEMIVGQVLSGNVSFDAHPSPSSMGEITKSMETLHQESMTKLKKLSDADFVATVKFPVGPKQMGDVPRNQVLWMLMMDTVHHRGQFSVYLRMSGSKVPSIYGPTADEPWM